MAARRLLIVNPNTDMRVTARLVSAARDVAGLNCAIDAVNAASGLAALVTPQDVAHAAQAVIDAVGARPCADAVLIGAFGDPGLVELRQREPSRRVVGLGEAGLRAAAAENRRFSIVTLGASMESPLRARIAQLGFNDLLASLTILPVPVEHLVAARAAQTEILATAIRHCFDKNNAQAVLLGGAPFAGLAAKLQPRFAKPILDGVAAAVAALN